MISNQNSFLRLSLVATNALRKTTNVRYLLKNPFKNNLGLSRATLELGLGWGWVAVGLGLGWGLVGVGVWKQLGSEKKLILEKDLDLKKDFGLEKKSGSGKIWVWN